MPINSSEILNIVTQLTEDTRVRVTMKQSLKGGCIAATATVIGGMMLGPPGLAIGGAVGGCAAAVMSKDKFKSVPQIIMQDMTYTQREMLVASVSKVIADLRIEDIVVLVPMLLNNPGAKEAVLRSVFAFLQNEMQLQIMD